MLTELKFQLQLTPGKSKFPNVPGVVPGDIFSSRKQTSLLAQPVSKALLPWSTDGNSMSTQIVLPANGYRNTDELTVIIVCARARVHVYINTLSSSVLWHIGVKKKKKIISTSPSSYSQNFGESGELDKVRNLIACGQCTIPGRTHYMPVDVLRVVWEGDLLERKSTE